MKDIKEIFAEIKRDLPNRLFLGQVYLMKIINNIKGILSVGDEFYDGQIRIGTSLE
jgi:hypothetical protein